MTGLAQAVQNLRHAGDSARGPRPRETWRWLVRHRLDRVVELMQLEGPMTEEAWLSPREQGVLRERDRLVAHLRAVGDDVVEAADASAVRSTLGRLIADLERHLQRGNDLVYDSVSMELGGSD